MKTKIQGFIALLRPFTLLAPFIVSISVIIASYAYSQRSDLDISQLLIFLLPASFCFVLLNGASNALNQATDFIEDAISKPYRPIPKKILSRKEVLFFSFILYVCALFASLFIHTLFSFFILIIAFFSITYSLPPRMKKKLFINQIWVAVPRGFCAILASWSVFSDPFQPVPLVMGGVATLFLIGGTSAKDIIDVEADRAVGTKTLVNYFGIQKTAIFSLVCMSSAFLMIVPMIVFQIIQPYFLPLGIFFLFGILISWLMLYTHKNKNYENTSAWSLMYGTYFLFSLFFSFLTVLHTF
ncbi:MAG: UbiA family prenyltransferase [Candidatus Thermoplasmatota archaeon]